MSNEDVADLKTKIADSLNNTIVAEWFDGSWDKLYCERSIVSDKLLMKRPDRVMICGDKAVVVDYKFGEEDNRHSQQVLSYMEKLQEMGYRLIEGYVWYVSAGKIVQIDK